MRYWPRGQLAELALSRSYSNRFRLTVGAKSAQWCPYVKWRPSAPKRDCTLTAANGRAQLWRRIEGFSTSMFLQLFRLEWPWD